MVTFMGGEGVPVGMWHDMGGELQTHYSYWFGPMGSPFNNYSNCACFIYPFLILYDSFKGFCFCFFFKRATVWGAWGLRGWVSDPSFWYLYFIFWIFKDRFFRVRFLVTSFPNAQPFHCSSSATSMPQMTLFFTLSCLFGKHIWVPVKLAGCAVGREKGEKKDALAR